MSKAKLNVLFKKIQKDDKKEVLEFHVQGDELPFYNELIQMAGSIVVLDVENSESGEMSMEFKSIQRDSKKTTLKFNVKGDSDDKIIKLYPLAGRGVTITLVTSQISIEEFYDGEDHEGVEYTIGKDGTASVSPEQMSLEDVAQEENETVVAVAEENDPVTVPIEDDESLFDDDDDLLD